MSFSVRHFYLPSSSIINFCARTASHCIVIGKLSPPQHSANKT